MENNSKNSFDHIPSTNASPIADCTAVQSEDCVARPGVDKLPLPPGPLFGLVIAYQTLLPVSHCTAAHCALLSHNWPELRCTACTLLTAAANRLHTDPLSTVANHANWFTGSPVCAPPCKSHSKHLTA